MALFIGFLTFVLVLNCLFLILLVLIQLPKKEAGAGIAFGGGTTDALFGAGTGNALTNLTKYSAAVFLGLSLVLAFLNIHNQRASSQSVEKLLTASPSKSSPAAMTPAPAAAAPLTAATNQLLGQPAVSNRLLTVPAQTAPAPRPAAAPIKK